MSGAEVRQTQITRRRALQAGAGGLLGLLGAGAAAFELVDHGVLPGRVRLDELLGRCSLPAPPLSFSAAGPSYSGTFFSRARNRVVGYTIAYPPGHAHGSELPLVVSLHPYGGNHNSGLGGISLARALAARQNGVALPPFALVSVDGGGLYWNPHPGDDPVAMIVDELIPMARRRGLGRGAGNVGVVGISMGGCGALLLGEWYPRLFCAVAAISPAIWTSYAQARAANAGAYASAADFARDDVVTHASALSGIAVRIASGDDDPFHAGVMALAAAAPSNVQVHISQGCHDNSFFGSQQHPSLAFLGAHLGRA